MFVEQRKYNIITRTVTSSIHLSVPPNCNGFLAYNAGDTIFNIANFPLLPAVGPGLSGHSWGVMGNKDEIYGGDNHTLNIQQSGPLGVNPLIIIVFKFYL